MKLCILLVYLSLLVTFSKANVDLYKLLGIAKDASLKEIRRAFKSLAVLKHPDKNPDDANAQSEFIQLTRAYDILKDPETRRTYDLYGDGDFGQPSSKFRSYTYYKNDFGIYDDDPLIVTLSKSDYELHILDESQAWWVNFYSPACHHCHKLAPTWRELSKEFEGIVRIAAVNCEEDWVLCHQLGINAYPTLLYYEKQTHLSNGEKYTGAKNFLELEHFILTKIQAPIERITRQSWDVLASSSKWLLLFLCATNCPSTEMQIKLAATFDGLILIGIIEDESLCEEILKNHSDQPIVLLEFDGNDKIVHSITGNNKKEYVEAILNALPAPEHVDETKYEEINNKDVTWLLCFYLGAPTELNLQLKRLPALIPHIEIGLVNCAKSAALCNSLHVSSYPTWGLLKAGGAFEKHHGRDVLHEVADFAREGAKATNLHALTPTDYENIRNSDAKTWFIDWYAPWCPPCRRLMSQMRTASQHFNPDMVKFGTIDCTQHSGLCNKENIRSFPTTILYTGGKQQRYHGVLNEPEIVEFINDAINSEVFTLTSSNFEQLIRKPVGHVWVVDYHAPWCGPCKQLMPVWRRFAREMKQFVNITIASVDCVENSELCSQQNIFSYPMIRLYPGESLGLNSVAMYTGHRDVLHLKKWIFAFIPSKVVALDRDFVEMNILSKTLRKPWLLNFHAPWCSHCVNFEPSFRGVADELVGIAKVGKVDCQSEARFCSELRVNSYPTLRLYFSSKFFDISSKGERQIVDDVMRIIRMQSKHAEHDEL